MTTLNTIIEEEKKEFIEKGADIEHERWSKWQAYLHSKCVEHSDGKGEWVCFPSELFKRWERQINTPYSELSEAEKESDREQVRSYDALLTTAMQRAYEAGLADSEHENTPGTEWEKRLRIDFEVAYGSMPKNFEHVPSVHISDWWLEKLSSRDTYWKERMLAILAGHGKGCDQKYHAECIEMIREEITNEDNFK